MKILKYSLLTFLILKVGFVFSQANLNNEVDVVKAYDPKISESFKIDVLPKIVDTTSVVPVFNYSINVKQFNTSFNLEPIQPAKMIGEPLTKLYRNYAKFGFGNYNTILFDYNFSTLRSKQSLIGVNLSYLSSDSKLKLVNDKKVFTGYSDNFVQVFGKRFFKNTNLYGDMDYNRNLVHLYGYKPEIDTAINKDDNIQLFNLINANAGIASMYLDSNHLNYNIAGHFHYFGDNYDNYENGIELSAKFDKKYFGQIFGIDAKVMNYAKTSSIDTINNTILCFDPSVKLFVSQFEVVAGFNMNSDIYSDSVLYHFYPHLSLQFNIIDNILVPYAGFGGKFEPNYFKKNFYENPFIKPGLIIKNTNYNNTFFGGIRGNLSSKLSYNLQVMYADVYDMYFYVNDTNTIAQNQFIVEYENNIQILNYYLEVAYKKSDKLYFLLKGNYYKYTMLPGIYAWHKPGYEVTLTAKYNIQNKFIITADIFGIDKRKVKVYNLNSSNHYEESIVDLKEIVDVNLGVEYCYKKNISLFVKINNIGASKYYKWNNYPTQQFNLLGGLSYSFL